MAWHDGQVARELAYEHGYYIEGYDGYRAVVGTVRML